MQKLPCLFAHARHLTHARPQAFAKSVSELGRTLGDVSAEAMSSPDLQKQAMGLLSQAHNMCCLMESAVMGACERGLKLQGSTSRLAMVSLCVLLTLLREGLCTPPEGDPDDEGETEPTDGFGMGEGTGEKNVSDEIEDEEQLTGAEQQGGSPKP
jgi:midasin (ATPase involved in ribosome maturation)